MDLKNRNARIIIADIHNKYAQMALCEAYKLEVGKQSKRLISLMILNMNVLQMTAYHGYVWFLPSWLSKDWSTISTERHHSCTSQELEQVEYLSFRIQWL